MPVLDCPIPKQNWAHEVPTINGATKAAPGKLATAKSRNAGTWEPVVQRIVDFHQLDEDWDGLGAKAPSREVLESAIGLAYTFYDQGVTPPDNVVPNVDGTVVFEWQYPDGTYAEVEIDRPLHAEVMVIPPGQPAQHWTLPTD